MIIREDTSMMRDMVGYGTILSFQLWPVSDGLPMKI
jgi:hypothetical protein